MFSTKIFTSHFHKISTRPFMVLLLTLFLGFARRIFVFVIIIIDIGFVGIHLNVDMVAKPHLYRMRQ